MRARSVFVALSFAVAGCKGSAMSTSDEPPKTVTVEQVPPSAAPTGEVAIGDPVQAPAPTMPPVRGLPQIGSACPPPEPAPQGARTGRSGAPIAVCGTKARVSLRWDPHTTMNAFAKNELPCTLVSVDKKKTPREQLGESHQACTADGRIYALSACMMCRLPQAGWSAVGLIAEMTREQSLTLQAKLGLSEAAPLRTTDDWQKAITAASS